MKTIGQMAAELTKVASEPVTPKGEGTESKIVNAMNKGKRLGKGGYDPSAAKHQTVKLRMPGNLHAYYMLRGDKWAPGLDNFGEPMSKLKEVQKKSALKHMKPTK